MATSVRERTSSIKVSGSNPEGNIEMLANGTISCEKEEKKKEKKKKGKKKKRSCRKIPLPQNFFGTIR